MSRSTVTAPPVIDILNRVSGSVAIIGSANADITVRTSTLPRPGETVAGAPVDVLPGGKSANQAAQASLLGAAVAFLGAIGQDAYGDLLEASLIESGVDITHLDRIAEASGTAVITVDDYGENTIVVSAGANDAVDEYFVDTRAIVIRDAVVVGLCLEAPLSGVLAAARLASEHHSQVLLNLSPFREVPAELLQLVDVLVVNETELSDLLGEPVDVDGLLSDHFVQESVAVRLAVVGVARAVVTLGGRGALVLDGHVATPIRAISITPVDTTGCGDSFFGAILAALASGASLVDACRMATVTAAVAATRRGAQRSYADRSELRDLLGH
ncbi:ribokinase [Microbacterium sp. NPDC087589]|uniref:ribokinase n=1 Tax=Microbacterium sp. NPDC087589 TaxID=3364191 RepID=UPI00381FF51A